MYNINMMEKLLMYVSKKIMRRAYQIYRNIGIKYIAKLQLLLYKQNPSISYSID